MQLGMIGLGRMGANMVIRLTRAGHDLCVYDRHAETVREMEARGAKGFTNLETFVRELRVPRAVWLMLPAGSVDSVLEAPTGAPVRPVRLHSGGIFSSLAQRSRVPC